MQHEMTRVTDYSRILLVSPCGFGGIQSFCIDLSEAFRNLGYGVHILFEQRGAESEPNPPVSSGVAAEILAASPFDNYYHALTRMADFIRGGGFDIVYPNTSSVTYRALGLLGPRRPVAIGGCHGNNEHDYASTTEFAGYLDHIFSVSQIGATVLRDRLSGRDLGITVIPHGVEPADILPGRSYSGKLRLVFAGRFDAGKRIRDIMLVTKGLRDLGVRFDITLAGDGPERRALEDVCSQLGLGDTVRLLGRISREQVQRLMQESHINLLLSESEGFGLSVREGMKVGCVPIVTETCGCKDAIRDGVNGFVVKLGNVGAVAGLVRRLEQDRMLLARISEAAARTVLEDYSAEKEVARHLELLRLAQEHHQRHAARTVPWRYEPPTLINSPWVPNWLARGLRRARHRLAVPLP